MTDPIPQAAERVLALLAHTTRAAALFDEHDALRWASPAFLQTLGLSPQALPDRADIAALGWSLQTEAVGHSGWVLCLGLSPAAEAPRAALPTAALAQHTGSQVVGLGAHTLPQAQGLAGPAHRVAAATSESASGSARVCALPMRPARATPSAVPVGVQDRAWTWQRLRLALPLSAGCEALSLVLVALEQAPARSAGGAAAAADGLSERIARLALRLQRGLRRGDICGLPGEGPSRDDAWGDDVLVLALRGACATAAAGVLKRLSEREQTFRPLDDMPARCELMSFGVAQAGPGDSVESLLARAHMALREARQRGPGSLVVAGEPGALTH